MFTGIVEAVGTVSSVERSDGITTFTITGPDWIGGLALGASVAVNGVCLTVVQRDDRSFRVEAVPETLQRTNLGNLEPGDGVNLERAARLGDPMDGHLVTGHVDGTGTLVYIESESNDPGDGGGRWITVQAPREIMQYVVPKGSIAIDGVSLTVVDHDNDSFRVVLIPHTWDATIFKQRRPGDRVNLEADLIGKYVHRFVKPYISPPSGGSTLDT